MPAHRIDMTGQRFGKWVVIRPAYYHEKYGWYWECRCDCGRTKNVLRTNLINGHSTSCGCQPHAKTHGESGERLYRIWCAMKDRCYRKTASEYHNYGARGIEICEEWKKDYLDFTKDKQEFSNTTCSYLDKIFHYDNIPLLDQDSKQTVYEDMEFVYYVLAKNKSMLHSNESLYEYHMRGLTGNSTSAIGLNMNYSNGISGLLSASTSMQEKFKKDGLFDSYEQELESIMIKLIYQRIHNIFFSNSIENKKEMALHMIDILNSYLPNWQENIYYQNHFQNSEYNDYLFYLSTEANLKKYHIDKNYTTHKPTEELLKDYDKKIKIKKLG